MRQLKRNQSLALASLIVGAIIWPGYLWLTMRRKH